MTHYIIWVGCYEHEIVLWDCEKADEWGLIGKDVLVRKKLKSGSAGRVVDTHESDATFASVRKYEEGSF